MKSHHDLFLIKSKLTSIRRPHDFLAKDSAGPVLAHDKGSSGHSDEGSQNVEILGRLDEARAGGGNGGKAEHHAEQNSGPVLVAESADLRNDVNEMR